MSGEVSGVYLHSGTLIRSDIVLDLPIVHDAEAADVVVQLGDEITGAERPPRGDVLAEMITDGAPWYTLVATDDGYLMRFRDCGDFVISADVAEVSVRPHRGGRTDLLPILLAGTVSAALLALRGSTVLHASAVSVDGDVVAFVGQSGRGKTTMAALMCLGGDELVAEDVLCVQAGTVVSCIGGITHLRLRAAASELAEMFPASSNHVTSDDRRAVMPQAVRKVLSLRAVVIPSPTRATDVVTVRRFEPADALMALLSFPRLDGWRDREVLGRDFGVLARVASTVPVVEATIPWGPPFRPDIRAHLLAQLAAVS